MGDVIVHDVSKSYPIYARPSDRLKELLRWNRHSYHQDFWALREVTVGIPKGSTFGLIGENGSGKSTLLQLIAGILRPTLGRVEVEGRVSALLELGSGFNGEFSGRENVFLNGAILGLSNKEIERLYPSIEEFAEIGNFIDQPVRTYSSGMMVRLAFAVAINLDPEILLVDEALAVGDIYFRQRCMRKIHELHRNGVTIIFVSHSASDIKSLAEQVVWLEQGRVVDSGEPDRVVGRYLAAMVNKDSRYRKQEIREEEAKDHRPAPKVIAPEVVDRIPNIDYRYGNRDAEIIGITILNEDGEPMTSLPVKASIIVRISVRANAEVTMPVVGFLIRNHLGIELAGTNTAVEEIELPSFSAGDIYTIDFHLQLPELYPGHFSFTPAVANGTLEVFEVCDWIDNAISLQAEKGRFVYGYIHVPCRVQVNAMTQARVRVGGAHQ